MVINIIGFCLFFSEQIRICASLFDICGAYTGLITVSKEFLAKTNKVVYQAASRSFCSLGLMKFFYSRHNLWPRRIEAKCAYNHYIQQRYNNNHYRHFRLKINDTSWKNSNVSVDEELKQTASSLLMRDQHTGQTKKLHPYGHNELNDFCVRVLFVFQQIVGPCKPEVLSTISSFL